MPPAVAGFQQVANTVLSNTISNTQNTIQAAQQIANSILGEPTAPNILQGINGSDLEVDATGDNIPKNSTGFYQFNLLKYFLEMYSNIKKTKDGAKYRLGLAMHKTGEMYIVTPQRFEAKQSAQSPLQYSYSLQFKAWKRIQTSSIPSAELQTDTRTPDLLSTVLNDIDAATDVLADAAGIINGLRTDVNHVLFDPLREVSLFIKGVANLGTTLVDFPANIVSDSQKSIAYSWGSIKSSINTIKGLPDRMKTLVTHLDNSSDFLAQNTGTDGLSTDSNNAQNSSFNSKLSGALQANALKQAFQDPIKNRPLFKQINLTNLNLPITLKSKINNEVTRVAQLDRVYFENKRIDMQNLATDFADSVGLGDTEFDVIYNRPVIVTSKVATDNDFNILFNLNKILVTLDSFIVNVLINNNNIIPKSIDYVAGLAQQSGAAFQIPISKFAVPFPYGFTLERLALNYLGDANRWLEIVTLNGLREPFVDEHGFDLSLQANGVLNQVIVNDITNLFIGQSVIISSDSTIADKRHIINIEQISNISYLISLDGALDLNKFTTLANAVLHAYLPGTVNSQQSIFIPSNLPSDENPQLATIPGVNDFDGLLDVGGIDLLLDQNGDIVLTPDGNSKWAFGLTNMVQAAHILLTTQKGSLLLHPSFGVDLDIGNSSADSDAKTLLGQISTLLKADPRFSGVSSIVINRNGPTTTLKIDIKIKGTNHILPLSIGIPT